MALVHRFNGWFSGAAGSSARQIAHRKRTTLRMNTLFLWWRMF